MRPLPVLVVAALLAVAGCSDADDPGPDEAASAGRCDLAFNTAEFNRTTTLATGAPTHEHHHGGEMRVDFTLEEWADTFVDPDLGVAPAKVAADYAANPALEEMVLSGTFTSTISPDPWVPMTDPAQCDTLADELQRARDAAQRFPTVADALAAGYTPGSIYAPGQGAHFTKTGIIDELFDPDEPELLMYDGGEPTSELMGLSYYLWLVDGLPAGDVGFTGGSDIWHQHQVLCRNPEGMVQGNCDGGNLTRVESAGGWMTHAWVVPGCESDWGIFSGANPRLKYFPLPDTRFGPGCDSGKAVTDPLDLEDAGEGPRVT